MRTLLLSMVFLVLSDICRADSPLPAPTRRVVLSPNGAISAISDPGVRTTVFQDTATGKTLWQLPSWERSLFIANDGKHAVVGFGGLNLIPQNNPEQVVLFTFWREGRKIREVTAKDFVANKSPLKKTVSHYHWGHIEGIDAEGKLVVRDAGGKSFRYNMETGAELR
jgi:hypothetical protein